MVESEYAKAIYELAVLEKKVEAFKEMFDAVVSTMDVRFMEILSSPFINKEEKKKMVKKVYSSFDETFLHFLYVLVDHNRFPNISEIAKGYEAIVLEEKGIVRIELTSAVKLTTAQMNQFKQTLKAKYADKTIEIKNTVNPELIGGVQITTNLDSFDASVKGNLNKLRESL